MINKSIHTQIVANADDRIGLPSKPMSILITDPKAERPNRFQLWLVGLVVLALVATLIIVPRAVSADGDFSDSGVYAGLSAGRSSFFTDTDVCDRLIEEVTDEVLDDGNAGAQQTLDDIIAGTNCTDDDTGSAFSAHVGYQFNRYFGLEGAYTNFGEATAAFTIRATNSLGAVSATGDGSVEAEGVSLSALLSAPLGDRFAIFGKLGVLAWSSEASLSAAGSASEDGAADTQSVSARLSRDDDGADVLYGVGARYRLTPNFGIRADWTHYEVIEIDTVSIGVEVRFQR